MIIHFERSGARLRADLSKPIGIGIGIKEAPTANCFWAPAPSFEPVRAGDFVGSTALGGAVNFFDVRFNPHGNGAHTECVGHISTEPYKLSDCLRSSHFLARLVSVFPEKTTDGDRVIFKNQLEPLVERGQAEAIIIRTLPNERSKKTQNWSGSNPPYFHWEALEWLAELGFEHLLTDLPSVDREEDGGQLLGHRAWWRWPGERLRKNATITELIFVENSVKDGLFLLDLQTADFDLDACPSRPQLFELQT